MGYPNKTSQASVTVAQNASASAEIDLGTDTAIVFLPPAALEATTAQLSFLAATTSGGTFKVVKKNGTKLALPIAVDDWGRVNELGDLLGVRFLKIVCETAGGVAVAQAGGARVFGIIKCQIN